MIDQKIVNYPEGEQLIKAINIVTLKLLEFSNQTTSYCALVKLLHECCDPETTSSTKYSELVMKCIWRQIRRLSNPPGTIEALIQQIDTSKVLQEIHAFLKLYPSSSWQNRSTDLPLRTVKTLLYHLAKAKQSQIIDDLNSINAPDDSEIKIYITKLFKNGFQLSNNVSIPQSGQGLTNGNNTSFGFTRSNGPSQTININSKSNALPDIGTIIKKISSPEHTKEGLNELYNFRQQNPDIDLNKYFKNSSGKLQNYIQDNLRLIEAERAKSNSNGLNGSFTKQNTLSNTNIVKQTSRTEIKSDYMGKFILNQF